MTRLIFVVTFLLVVSGAVVAQAEAGYAGQEGNLRGLKGVRLIVMFGRADGLDEAQRTEVLRTLEGDATAQLQKAGIPLFQFNNDEVEKRGLS